MLPNSKIVIEKDGSTKIIGEESTSNCYKLSELGKKAGKVVSDTDKDHPPVHQSVSQKA